MSSYSEEHGSIWDLGFGKSGDREWTSANNNYVVKGERGLGGKAYYTVFDGFGFRLSRPRQFRTRKAAFAWAGDDQARKLGH